MEIMLEEVNCSQARYCLGCIPERRRDMSVPLYNLAKLIVELKAYQEVGATLIPEEEIERCLSTSRHPPPADEILAYRHELITLHAGTCDRCRAFFVRPLGRKPNQDI